MNRNVILSLFVLAALLVGHSASARQIRPDLTPSEDSLVKPRLGDIVDTSPSRYALNNSLTSTADRSGLRQGQTNRGTERAADPENPIRDRMFYAGLAYPGILVGMQTSSMAVELRAFRQNDITIYGPRLTHYLYPFRGGNFYWGLEAQYIENFEGDLTEGDGYMAGGFLGLQKYIGSRVSFNVDAGPSFIQIEDEYSGLEVDGIEYVVNTSLNFHF